MKVCHGIHNLEGFTKGAVLTLGNFDGVHSGHRQIIERALEISQKLSASSVVFTFSPHPVQVISPESGFKRIFSEKDQEFELKKMGVSLLNVEPFSLELSQVCAEDFFENYIWQPLKPSAIVIGYDFAFGSDKKGTVAFLRTICEERGIHLEMLDSYKREGRIVSSTLIRELIQEGKVDEVPSYLGRHFYLEGKVIEGARRGRRLGFPTANTLCPTELQVCYGVYVSRVWIEGEGEDKKSHLSVTNVGYSPTFSQDGERLLIETHILDFDRDVYGKMLRVDFLKFMRHEKKFPSIDELSKQIKMDIDKARSEK